MTTTIQSAATTLREPGVEFEFDEAQLAAVSFLARYSGRTLEAYRHDLRGFFQWATDNRIVVLGANRAHIELFRAWMGPTAGTAAGCRVTAHALRRRSRRPARRSSIGAAPALERGSEVVRAP